MSLKRNAAAFGVGAAVAALYVLSRDDETKDALLDAFEDIREGVAGAIERVRAAADAIVERVTAPESDPPAPPPAAAASPLQRLFKEVAPMASSLADHEAFDEEEAPEDQDEDDALADAADAIATHPAAVPSFVPSGDTTPLTANPSPTVSPFKVTYPIGGTPTKPPPEEEDEARALADAIDAAADDADEKVVMRLATEAEALAILDEQDSGAVMDNFLEARARADADAAAADARSFADAIDAAADDALRGEGFIGSQELTAQLLQVADASRVPPSPFAELSRDEALPPQ